MPAVIVAQSNAENPPQRRRGRKVKLSQKQTRRVMLHIIALLL
jgi:hypothetical protein